MYFSSTALATQLLLSISVACSSSDPALINYTRHARKKTLPGQEPLQLGVHLEEYYLSEVTPEMITNLKSVALAGSFLQKLFSESPVAHVNDWAAKLADFQHFLPNIPHIGFAPTLSRTDASNSQNCEHASTQTEAKAMHLILVGEPTTWYLTISREIKFT